MDQALSLAGLEEDVDVKNLLTFVGISSKKKTALSGSIVEVVESITSIVDDMFLQTIQQRTSEEFRAVRHRVFPKYIVAVQALSYLVRQLVPETVLEPIVYESFSELEADFREHGLNKFGTAVRDQAMFTVWTMRKINDLVIAIHKAGAAPKESAHRDTECAAQFGGSTAWAQFHMDFLLHAIHHGKPVFPEVLEDIQDGLRAIVNAYAWLRQGVDLRIPPVEPAIQAPDWDAEDDELLLSAMHDMEADFSSDGDD